MKPLVYIAGPYTHPDPILNTRRAVEVAEEVLALGGTPFIPHLTMLWHLVSPKPVEDWYAIDLDMLAHCSCVLRFEGVSTGADAEVIEAKRLGIPVYYGTDDGELVALLTGGSTPIPTEPTAQNAQSEPGGAS